MDFGGVDVYCGITWSLTKEKWDSFPCSYYWPSEQYEEKISTQEFWGLLAIQEEREFESSTSNASVSSNTAKNERFKEKCNFFHKIGHKQADCFKFKNWLEKKKKGKIVVVVNFNANMIETNIVDVHANSSWLDTGATIHVTNSL